MTLAEGFEVRLFASEPDIRQPVSMTFDERGRMWINQYIQYPTPKDLKPVEVDRYLRTKYDTFPQPPPRGPKGADKITIAEDTDGDGRADAFKDFVTGLNLATGVEIGYGGVFVLQSPYLLFYPDRDRDDVPDGDPEVLLAGFGMEDAHAFANSLTWGPDGWLYGAQGSTVTAKIRGIVFQQGIWRYHPITKAFELFSEGGGNTWGLDFDAAGQAIAGTNWGGFAMLHQVQGAYYIKNFGKHGELQNPHAYGYFDHVPYERFIGGHVTAGGIVYQGGAFPESFKGKYIGANLLSNQIHWHEMTPHRSTFTARHGGVLLDAHDTWFRPVDCALGPDGSVFVADWYDQRATHVDPKDDWDRTNGRIYKIVAKGAAPVKPRDLAALTSDELVNLLSEENVYYRRIARRLLAERRDAKTYPKLNRLAFNSKSDAQRSLEAFWTLAASGGFDTLAASDALAHKSEHIRAWGVRLIGDRGEAAADLGYRLEEMAASDASAIVRSQLACTARRLRGQQGLPIVRALAMREDDADDPFIPLLAWWALEAHAEINRPLIMDLYNRPEFWDAPLAARVLTERIARRYAAEGKAEDFETCSHLLALAPEAGHRAQIVAGMERGLEGKSFDSVPPAFATALERLWSEGEPGTTLVRLALRLGSGDARELALARAADESLAEADRAAIIDALAQTGVTESVPVMLMLVEASKSNAVRRASFAALSRFNDDSIAKTALALYPNLNGDLRSRARQLLAGRASWAALLLGEVEAGRIDKAEFREDDLRRIALHESKSLNATIEKHWGKVGRQTDGERAARIGGIVSILGLKPPGDPARGRELFLKACATCHVLFGEGKKVGPELTGADRKNRDFLLTNIVDPSAMVRTEYMNYLVETKDGRLLTGLIAESGPSTVTLLDAQAERTTLPMSDVKEIRPSDVSLMPEELLDSFTQQEVRDLFSYLQSDDAGTAGTLPAQ